MASTAFLAALKKTRQSKELDKVLVGSNTNWLREGTHTVVVKAIDSSTMDDNKLSVTYANDDGKEYTDRIFLMNQEGDELSLQFRKLLTGTLADTEAFDILFAAMEKDPKVIESLTGMKLGITLAFGRGFVTKVTGNNGYIAVDKETDEVLTEEFPTLQEARDKALADGHKRAYLRVASVQATHSEQNIETLKLALSNRGSKTAEPVPGSLI